MSDALRHIDVQLLLWINGAHDGFFDQLMWLVSNRFTWILMYLALFYVIILKHGFSRKLLFVIFLFVAAVGLSDFVCASIIRHLAVRPRPTHIASGISSLVHIVNNYHGGRYGFPSCHASNSFALATMTALYFRKRSLTLFIFAWALLLCYSRIYLGVHYPSDILGGAVVGTAFAFVIYYAVKHYVILKENGKFRYINAIPYTGSGLLAALIIMSLL